MSLVVRQPDTLFLPPSIVPKWRGLRGLVEHLRLAVQALLPVGRGELVHALAGLRPRLTVQPSAVAVQLRRALEQLLGDLAERLWQYRVSDTLI